MHRKENISIISFVKIFYLSLAICLFISLTLIVIPAYSGEFKLIKVNSHYEPEISEGIILPGTNTKAGVFTYVIDEVKADETSKAGFLIKDKIYYVESDRYAHIQPKNWLEYTGTFDPGGDPNFGIFEDYFVMDAYSIGASHNRKMFLFRFNEDTVQLLDVIVEAYVNNIEMDFISAYEETDKVAPIGKIPHLFKDTCVSWINIKDVDRDGNPEFKVVIREKRFELYFEIANDRLQVDFNPDLYAPLFEREKLKKTKRKSDAYYIYGFLANELDLKKIKAMMEGTCKKPYEQYGRVVALLEGHKEWDSAFHNYLGENPILKQCNLKRR
ncbi:MAG: hypothetical protein AB1422_14345 [bacterium]